MRLISGWLSSTIHSKPCVTTSATYLRSVHMSHIVEGEVFGFWLRLYGDG